MPAPNPLGLTTDDIRSARARIRSGKSICDPPIPAHLHYSLPSVTQEIQEGYIKPVSSTLIYELSKLADEEDEKEKGWLKITEERAAEIEQIIKAHGGMDPIVIKQWGVLGSTVTTLRPRLVNGRVYFCKPRARTRGFVITQFIGSYMRAKT